jgi:hypothetical protein
VNTHPCKRGAFRWLDVPTWLDVPFGLAELEGRAEASEGSIILLIMVTYFRPSRRAYHAYVYNRTI